MMTFGKKDADGYFHSNCGRYVIWRKSDEPLSSAWSAATWPLYKRVAAGVEDTVICLKSGVDFDEARWACEDDLHRQPCGCVLTLRADWWKHCPKCGAVLPPRKPFVPVPRPPKKEKKKPTRPDWLVQRTRGTEGGHEWDCVYEGKSWALVRIPGRTSWASVGHQAYYPTEWTVMKKSYRMGYCVAILNTDGATMLHDHGAWDDKSRPPGEFQVHEGRMNKELLATIKQQVDLLDKERA